MDTLQSLYEQIDDSLFDLRRANLVEARKMVDTLLDFRSLVSKLEEELSESQNRSTSGNDDSD